MAKVFVSFLGTGSPKSTPGYDRATYNWPGKSATTVTAHFAQTAILKILEEQAGAEASVDKVVILCTEESEMKHLSPLREELQAHLAAPPELIVPRPLVPTDMSAANQWGWFEQLLEVVEQGDTLIIDFTHGMRAVPIVFSSAIGFLQRAKGVTLAHALYAWYDVADKGRVHPIVDMRDFYVINDWAEAVARLTDDADARKLGELAEGTDVAALRPLKDKTLIQSFAEMTDCIRNVDVNHVGEKVNAALQKVQQARNGATGSAQVMLDLVWRKFSALASDYPPSGRYDSAYFETQLAIIRVLLEHRLFMQAYTAMREFLGSIGMAGLQGKYEVKKMTNKEARGYRTRFAEGFVGMLQTSREKWDVPLPDTPSGSQRDPVRDRLTLKPWFDTLEQAGVITDAIKGDKGLVKELCDIRNGFDHAWTARPQAEEGIADKGAAHLALLEGMVARMTAKRLLS